MADEISGQGQISGNQTVKPRIKSAATEEKPAIKSVSADKPVVKSAKNY